jgi:hypothetical protein
MRLGARAKAALVAALFVLPIVASFVAYRFLRPAPTANYGELLLPPAQLGARAFEGQRGRWILIAADSGDCADACQRKLHAMRQVRLALGRNASRVARVLVNDDARQANPNLAADTGLEVSRGVAVPPGASNDRSHIYLADPHGNVILRWPADPDLRRMYQDIDRLLKASQIG